MNANTLSVSDDLGSSKTFLLKTKLFVKPNYPVVVFDYRSVKFLQPKHFEAEIQELSFDSRAEPEPALPGRQIESPIRAFICDIQTIETDNSERGISNTI